MLASVAELSTYMDMKFTNRQEDAALLVLAGLQGELEAIIRRPAEVQEFVEEYRIPATYQDLLDESYFHDSTKDTSQSLRDVVVAPYVLHLRNSPVAEVTEIVRIDPDGSEVVWDADVDFVVRRWGLDLFNVVANDLIRVTYTAGLDGETIPYLKMAILRAASRELQNMVDDVVGLKDMQTRQATVATVGFTADEIAILKRYKRRMF